MQSQRLYVMDLEQDRNQFVLSLDLEEPNFSLQVIVQRTIMVHFNGKLLEWERLVTPRSPHLEQLTKTGVVTWNPGYVGSYEIKGYTNIMRFCNWNNCPKHIFHWC